MILLTGSTGFVGSFLLLELLKRDKKVVALARSNEHYSARARVLRALELASGQKKDPPNLIVMEGDVSRKLFDLSLNDLAFLFRHGVEEIWHSAGSINFSTNEKKVENTRKINVGGMENLLHLSEFLAIKKIFYLGTAYADCNICAECYFDVDLPRFNNPYEESKFDSENKLLAWAEANPAVDVFVFKPSIIVGDTNTGRAFNFSGFYRYFQSFYVFRRMIMKKHDINCASKLLDLPMWVPGHELAEINLISVDYAIGQMMRLCQKGLPGIYYIINENAPVYREVVDSSLLVMNIQGIKYLNAIVGVERGGRNGYAYMEKKLRALMKDYIPYVSWTYRWDTSSARSVLENEYKEHPIIEFPFYDRMISYAVKHKFELSV